VLSPFIIITILWSFFICSIIIVCLYSKTCLLRRCIHQGVQCLVPRFFTERVWGKTSMLLPDYGLLRTIMPKVFYCAHSITFSVTLTLTLTKCNVDTVEPGWPLSKHTEIPNISLTILGYTAHLPYPRDRHRTVVIHWTDMKTRHNFFSKL